MNFNRWAILAAILSIFIMAGFSTPHVKKDNPILIKAKELDSLIDKENWKKAEIKAKELDKIFNKKKWKIQLLGDEGEYEGMDRDIDQLIASIQSKEKGQSKILLADFVSILDEIYSF